MIKNVLYFTLKDLSFSRYLYFYLDFLVMWKTSLIRKIMLISIPVLIEYNIETFFLKNRTQNVVKKLFYDTFLKNQNWAYLCINCHPLGRLYSSARMRIVGRKNLTIFKVCHYSRFYVMISSSFWKIKTKNLNSDPRILIFFLLETTSPAAHWLSKH